MMRSLWTASSGMMAQQQNVDTISNNLANVNTTGYKKERLEFKTLLYQTMQRADLDPQNQTGRPVNLQVGLGVRPIATSKMFTVGNLQTTDRPSDFAIEGDGFFVVRKADNDIQYSRDGAFKLSVGTDGQTLVTSEGYQILGVDGNPIVIPQNVPMTNVTVGEDGKVAYTDATGATQDLGTQIDLVQFANPQGLESSGSNLFKTTSASGAPIQESSGDLPNPSVLKQGVIEMSNVAVAEEMVNLIVAQRAYELNSKAITTSDDMLQQANNLKR